jgi:hypothetical protein
MIKRLERLKNTLNKYMADVQPDRFTTCHSGQKLVVSRRPGVYDTLGEIYISMNLVSLIIICSVS